MTAGTDENRSAVLITGGAKRVGAALARACGAWGFDVALHYNTSAADAEAVARDVAQSGVRCATFQGDLADADMCEGLIGRVVREMPNLRAVVNNASLFDFDQSTDFDVAVWDRQMAVNLRAPAILSRDFANWFSANPGQKDGVLINIIDQKVSDPKPEFFSYTVSKCALERMTRLLAIDLAPAIRVNAVAPGLMLPSGKQTQAQFAAAHDKTPLERGGTVDALTRAIKYLISEPVVTGQIIFIDGGERFSKNRDYSELIDP